MDDSYDDDESSISSHDFEGFLSDDDTDEDDDDDGSDSEDDSLTDVSTRNSSPQKKPGKAYRKQANTSKHAHKARKSKKKRSRNKRYHGRKPAKEFAAKNPVSWAIDGNVLEKGDYDFCIEEKPKRFDTLAKGTCDVDCCHIL